MPNACLNAACSNERPTGVRWALLCPGCWSAVPAEMRGRVKKMLKEKPASPEHVQVCRELLATAREVKESQT